eukprot:GEMP01023146.1.p1 GENE.GEMP01023146.1~~GEMP01023146.1.p1  ORF type:complete len:290 (+),score=35.60 GEMP01023146.1:71-940(+)
MDAINSSARTLVDKASATFKSLDVLDAPHFCADTLALVTKISLALSIFFLFKQLRSRKGVDGVSFMAVFTTVFGRVLQCFGHGFYGLHYNAVFLPMSIYFSIDIVNAVIGILVLLYFVVICRKTNDYAGDNFGSGPLSALGINYAPFRWLFLVALIASCTVLVGWAKERYSDSLVEQMLINLIDACGSVALLPQLQMFNRGKLVSFATGNFVFFIICHRMLIVCFQINIAVTHVLPMNRLMTSLAFELLNVLVAANFIFAYAKARFYGMKAIDVTEVSRSVSNTISKLL